MRVGRTVATGVVVAAVGTWMTYEPSETDATRGVETREDALLVDILEPNAPVGWVFGRIVGVPGAERPLSSQGGFYGSEPLPPQP